ncbi:MAG: hypothetical protein ACM3WU_11095 [Bacillota bacterium]
MADSGYVTAKIQFRSLNVELHGPEPFVDRHLEWLRVFIEVHNLEEPEMETKMEVQPSPTPAASLPVPSANEDPFRKHFGLAEQDVLQVIHIDGQTFNIIVPKIPGVSTLAENQTKYCLLYCLANEYVGNPTTSFTELRELCKNMGCLDNSNFAATLTKNKKFFLVEGSAGSHNKTVRLTTPGREEARRLLASLIK